MMTTESKEHECSWADLRRIEAILKDPERFKGQVGALHRCVSKSALSNRRRAIEVMEQVQISELNQIHPSHAEEIGRRAKPDEWEQWVQECARAGWTVEELRARLSEDVGRDVTTPHEVNDCLRATRRCRAALQSAREQAEKAPELFLKFQPSIQEAIAGLREDLTALEEQLCELQVTR